MVELSKQQILNNLKWRNVTDELPYDGSRVEVRVLILRDNDITDIFDINYYHCNYFDNEIGGYFAIEGHPTISFNIENALKANKFEIKGFNRFGQEILLDLSKRDTIDLEYWQWRYPVEENGEITHFTMAL